MTLSTTPRDTRSIETIALAFRQGMEGHVTKKAWFILHSSAERPPADEWVRGYITNKVMRDITAGVQRNTGAELARVLWAKIERRSEMRWIIAPTLVIVPEEAGIGLLGLAGAVKE